MPARHFALIPAAGIGARLGADCPKQYLSIAGKPMLAHVLDTFIFTSAIDHVFVVVDAGDRHIEPMLAAVAGHEGRLTVLRAGGASRQDSVRNGLRCIREQVNDEDWILVHDAARPGLTPALIAHLLETVQSDPVGGLLALPVVDTLKRSADHRIDATVSRDNLWAAQTPQMFRYGLLSQALEAGGQYTDEAGAIEALGLKPLLVKGSPRNFKVTLPHDILLAELYLKGIA